MTPSEFYKKVGTFRKACGLHQTDRELHKKLFDEEMQEFNDAKTDADVADALVDMIFIYSGAMMDVGPIYKTEQWFWKYINEQANIANVDLEKAFMIVFDSNMSKLMKLGDVESTLSKFAAVSVRVEIKPVGGGLYAAFSAEDQDGDDGIHYPKGKLVKSSNYWKPDWTDECRWRSDNNEACSEC